MEDTRSVEKKAESFAKSDGNYTVREDGIAYCNACGEPRQTWKNFPNGKKLLWCSCKCLDAHHVQNNSERIKLLQERGNVSPNCTFDRAQASKVMEVCRRYASRWDEAADNGAGLLLWGDVGTGKTFAAHCVANELIRREFPVFITSLARVLNAGFDKSDVLIRIQKTPLVIFDDLGAERSSEYALETIFLLVDERYRVRKPFIVTTNMTLDEMKHPADIGRKRIYDRVLERCVPLHFDGGSKREEEAARMLLFMKELVSGGPQ